MKTQIQQIGNSLRNHRDEFLAHALILAITGLAVIALTGIQAEAAGKAATKTTAKKATASKSSDYSTNMSFEGTSLKGKVQSGSLRRIVVENDKSLDDLLGVRSHFDDRDESEKGRVTSW